MRIKKKLIVFDIDGTIADASHRIHFINREGSRKDHDAFFDACFEDQPIAHSISMLRIINATGFYDIEFWTGRPERIRDKTSQWLQEYVGLWTRAVPLIMRRDGDYRSDAIVKLEYLNGRRPYIIFEDRRKVVEAYRNLGLTVYQVADGNF